MRLGITPPVAPVLAPHPPAVNLTDTDLAAARWADQGDIARILLIPSLRATHTEFAATTNSFDLARRDDGNPVFQQRPWDPDHGRVVLRLARPAFPEIREWTGDIVDARYDPRTKLLAAIHGEPRRRAQWP